MKLSSPSAAPGKPWPAIITIRRCGGAACAPDIRVCAIGDSNAPPAPSPRLPTKPRQLTGMATLRLRPPQERRGREQRLQVLDEAAAVVSPGHALHGAPIDGSRLAPGPVGIRLTGEAAAHRGRARELRHEVV